MLPDSNSVQTINLPNLLLSAPEPDDPKTTSDAGDQKEHSLEEEKVSREENLRKIGKSRKRSKEEGEYMHIFSGEPWGTGKPQGLSDSRLADALRSRLFGPAGMD